MTNYKSLTKELQARARLRPWWATLSNEEEPIIWLEDPSKYPYVRTMVIFSSVKRQGQPKGYDSCKTIGYTRFAKDAEKCNDGFYHRRLFYLTPKDLKPDCVYKKTGGMPSEGVDPRTVAPGVWGVHIDAKQEAQ